jgi:anti-sigma-K factor RskA
VSPDHELFRELASAYALGALDGDDLARFRAHLEGCAECERLLVEYREALVLSAADLRDAPPLGVKRILMERVGRRRGQRGTARFWPGLRWAASVAIAAGLLASVISVFVSARYEMRIGRMAREVAALREQVARERQALVLLRDPATRVIPLAGLEPSPKAQGRMIWNEHEGGVFVAANLPPAPPGKAYELWAIAGGKPAPAAVFAVNAEGAGGARVTPLAGGRKVEQFAVTLEPAGGVPAPTGPMYLASKSGA